jgi:DNA-binding MarR family transcriptional regulator
MDSNQLDQLVDNITTIVPVIFKKIHKLKSSIIVDKNVSYVQVRILFALNKEKQISMSALGKKLEMQKPNVTSFVDKLIEEGLVERIYQEDDRRVIMISLTDKGTDYIENYLQYTKGIIRDRIGQLEDKDLEILQNILKDVKYLITKFENNPEIFPGSN